jgi:protein-S-isoprenylcysteine O-methyltransferase Ste14
MKQPTEIEKMEPSKLAVLLALPGSFLLATMSIALFVSVLSNAPALLEAEIYSLDVIIPYIAGIETSSALVAAAWIPIVICVIAFAIVIAGVAIVIWTNAVQSVLAEISRLSRLCPTLPWYKRGFCYSMLAALIGGLTAALGIFFTAVAVAMINILTVVIAFL